MKVKMRNYQKGNANTNHTFSIPFTKLLKFSIKSMQYQTSARATYRGPHSYGGFSTPNNPKESPNLMGTERHKKSSRRMPKEVQDVDEKRRIIYPVSTAGKEVRAQRARSSPRPSISQIKQGKNCKYHTSPPEKIKLNVSTTRLSRSCPQANAIGLPYFENEPTHCVTKREGECWESGEVGGEEAGAFMHI